MAQDEFNPKLGRIRDARRERAQRHAALVFRKAGKHGARVLRQRGHISPATPKRGMGAGLRAAAGLIAPGSRRVIERQLNVQPTIKVRPGWPLRVIVHKDLVLRPYRATASN